jgi:hypothetical protein
MIISLAIMALFITGIVLAVRAIAGHSQATSSSGHAVRRFFQYALLFGLVIIVAVGIAGLINRLISPASLLAVDQVSLARNTSFVLVGIPVLFGVATWTKRTIKSDSTEVKSFGWAAYMLLITVASLGTAMVGVATLLAWAFGLEDFSSYSIAQSLVWLSVWYVHFEVNRRITPINRSKFLFLFNSLIGLITSIVGFASIITGIGREILGYSAKDLLIGTQSPIKTGAILLIIGTPVWILYWVKLSMNSSRDVLWLGYVLIAGVAGGLVTAIVSASTVLYRTLVWLIGNPLVDDPISHFRSVPTSVGAALAGLLLLWYHNHFASSARTAVRNEIQRIYEYLISGIALIASTIGLILIIVSVFDVFSQDSIINRPNAINTLLGAVTVLVVGMPIWYLYWHRIQIHTKRQPGIEANSNTRRVYLFLLFGAGGIVSVVTLITAVFIIFESVFSSGSFSELIREVRYPLSILIGTVSISAYHWGIYRADKAVTVSEQIGPRLVTLIGPHDDVLRKAILDLTGGKVHTLESQDSSVPWSHAEIIDLVKNSNCERVVIAQVNGKASLIELKSS